MCCLSAEIRALLYLLLNTSHVGFWIHFKEDTQPESLWLSPTFYWLPFKEEKQTMERQIVKSPGMWKFKDDCKCLHLCFVVFIRELALCRMWKPKVVEYYTDPWVKFRAKEQRDAFSLYICELYSDLCFMALELITNRVIIQHHRKKNTFFSSLTHNQCARHEQQCYF